MFPSEASGSTDLRMRVPRGQLRDAEHPQGRAPAVEKLKAGVTITLDEIRRLRAERAVELSLSVSKRPAGARPVRHLRNAAASGPLHGAVYPRVRRADASSREPELQRGLSSESLAVAFQAARAPRPCGVRPQRAEARERSTAAAWATPNRTTAHLPRTRPAPAHRSGQLRRRHQECPGAESCSPGFRDLAGRGVQPAVVPGGRGREWAARGRNALADEDNIRKVNGRSTAA